MSATLYALVTSGRDSQATYSLSGGGIGNCESFLRNCTDPIVSRMLSRADSWRVRGANIRDLKILNNLPAGLLGLDCSSSTINDVLEYVRTEERE